MIFVLAEVSAFGLGLALAIFGARVAIDGVLSVAFGRGRQRPRSGSLV